MSQKIRIGMIGTSWWSDAMLLPSIKSHPQADLVAICGRNQIRAQEMADKYQIPQPDDRAGWPAGRMHRDAG
jgi:predicted dehydrogenase